MTWSNPSLVKQMEEIAAEAPKPDPNEQALYDATIASLNRLLSSGEPQRVTLARVSLALAPIIRDVKAAVNARDAKRAASMLAGFADALGAVTAGLLALTPGPARPEIVERIETATMMATAMGDAIRSGKGRPS